MRIREAVKQTLAERQNRIYEQKLQAKRMTYQQWCREREPISLLERAQETARGEAQSGYVVVTLGKGILALSSPKLIENYFHTHPQVQLLYGDEDVWEDFPNGDRHSPYFKPDWSPDLFDCCFYFGSLVAMRKSFYEKAKEFPDSGSDRELWIRSCVKAAGGYETGNKSIGHIPEILFHCENKEILLKHCIPEARQMGLRKESDAHGKEYVQYEGWEQTALPLVSVIVPSKDHPEILSACLAALPKAMGGLPYEVIVVDNGSREENRCELERLLEQHIYLYEPMEFNFSRMCDLGAEQAKGKFLLFLNDDVELCCKECVPRMAAQAARNYTGAVGIKLYYPDSVRIQHAGVTNLPMGPVHKLQFLEDTVSYYFDSNKGNRNVLAVTAACLMVAKEKFWQAGGFAQELPVAFNDVDFCFQLWELGYHNVCMNGLYAYHHESLSRGDDESPEKLDRLLRERNVLYERHPKLQGRDPYYSIHLNRQGLDTRIRPAFETAGNSIQEQKIWKEKDLQGYRQDRCLLVRVEFCTRDEILGYGVILGDNNACYEREILLKSEDGKIFSGKLHGQYRPDLLENMPDQQQVGLCGFWIRPEQLPAGKYVIGMAVKNRVTGLKLVQWSSRSIP